MSPVTAGQGQDDPISEGRTSGPRSYLPRSGTVLRVLTATQNCSALVFSVFVGIHLVSPLAAAVGGLSAADNALVSSLSPVVQVVVRLSGVGGCSQLPDGAAGDPQSIGPTYPGDRGPKLQRIRGN